VAVDWQKLMPPKGFQVLPRRWVVERTFFHGSTRTGG
jgi:transposase